jgi:hypothetical protein
MAVSGVARIFRLHAVRIKSTRVKRHRKNSEGNPWALKRKKAALWLTFEIV